MDPQFSQEELLRYSRHLMVPGIGLKGQKRLKDSSVLIVGAGGLGSPAALYLAAAGVGRLGIVDDDVVDLSNLQRQVLHGTSGIGKPKVESARERLSDLNHFVRIETHLDTFRQENAASIARGYDLLLDCSDNFATRYLINDLCVLTKRPYVYGAVYRFEGQVCVFDAQSGPCYRCLFPEPPPEGAAPACGEAGIFSLTPGLTGTLQAVEALKLLLKTGEPLLGRLLLLDCLTMNFKTIRLRKRPGCPLCGETPTITELQDYPAFCAISAGVTLSADELISPRELADHMKSGRTPLLLDVRSEVELQVSSLPGALNIPLEVLPVRLEELPREGEIVVFCRNGTRAARALRLLGEAGYKQVKNLAGGINAWAREIDPTMFEY